MTKEIVVLLGPPGVGKGVARLFLESEGYQACVISELLKADPFLAKLIDEGNLIDDDIVNGAVEEYLRRKDLGEKIVFDGYPRTRVQAINLYILSRGRSARLFVIQMEAEDSTLEERRMNRVRVTLENGSSPRPDDDSKIHKLRVKKYRERLPEILSFFRGGAPISFRKIDTDKKGKSEVGNEIKSFLQQEFSREESVRG